MENWLKEVQKRKKGIPVASGRSKKFGKISFDDLVFVPAQLKKRPVDYYKEEIYSKTKIGKLSQNPIEIETPIIFGAMSFGALSKEAKIALARASKIVGTIANTGEGGMLPEEREEAKFLIVQYSTGRFGITEEVLKKADAVEIKIGQGAKPGAGGFLPGKKVTKEIAKVRKVEEGKDLHSPAYHPDIKSLENLKKKVKWLKEITRGKPIIIKIAAGDVKEDVKIAVEAGADIVAIDGMEGGTGAAPEVLLNDVGVPTLMALVEARETLDEIGAQQELWIGGGFYKGADFAKALALGADAIFVGTSLLGAMGCIGCGMCFTGKCPKGIATQDENLRKNFTFDEAVEGVVNYIKTCTEEMKMIAGACGKRSIFDLSKKDLRALSLEVSKITKIRFS